MWEDQWKFKNDPWIVFKQNFWWPGNSKQCVQLFPLTNSSSVCVCVSAWVTVWLALLLKWEPMGQAGDDRQLEQRYYTYTNTYMQTHMATLVTPKAFQACRARRSKYAWASVGDSLSLRTCVCTWLHMWKRGSVFDSVQNGSSVWSTVWKSLSISDERFN